MYWYVLITNGVMIAMLPPPRSEGALESCSAFGSSLVWSHTLNAVDIDITMGPAIVDE